MAKDKKKAKKSGDKKLSKKERIAKKKADRLAKKAKRKGDGSFPNVLVVTKEDDKGEGGKGKHWFLGHNEDLSTLYKDGQTVAVYKLSRVSTMSIKRKVALVRS